MITKQLFTLELFDLTVKVHVGFELVDFFCVRFRPLLLRNSSDSLVPAFGINGLVCSAGRVHSVSLECCEGGKDFGC